MTARPTQPISITWDAGPSGTKSYSLVVNGKVVSTAGQNARSARFTLNSGDDVQVRANPSGQVQEVVVSWQVPAPPPPPPPPPSGNGSVTGRWFTDASPWNTPVGQNPQVDPNSKAWINLLTSSCPNGAFTDSNDWSTPVYFSTASTPIASVHITRDGSAVQFPYQSGWEPAPDGGDSHLAVIALDGSYWEFQAFQILSGGNLQAQGCSTGNVCTGDGSTRPDAVSDLPVISGLIRPQEIAAGTIPHGLRCAIPCASNQYRYPATRSDANTANGIPMGARLWLPSVPSGLDPYANMVATAIHVYGLRPGDSNGSNPAVSLKAESTIDGSQYAVPITSLDVSVLGQMVVLAAGQ